MKRTIFLFFLFFCTHSFAQKVAIKNNLAYDALKTPNLSLEFSMGRKWTLDTQVGMNFFFYTQDATSSPYKTKKASHWLVQPELRYWLCERFNGSFFGLHGHYADVDISNLDMFGLGHDRYDGKLYGAGISYGYQWILNKRWSMEATIGLGYAHIKYDKYEPGDNGQKLGHNTKDYFGPTKVGLSFIYIIK